MMISKVGLGGYSMSLAYSVLRHNYGIDYQRHGLKHRTDGPAIVYFDGDQMWGQYGRFHRTDGPSRIWEDMEICEYHIRGEKL